MKKTTPAAKIKKKSQTGGKICSILYFSLIDFPSDDSKMTWNGLTKARFRLLFNRNVHSADSLSTTCEENVDFFFFLINSFFSSLYALQFATTRRQNAKDHQ